MRILLLSAFYPPNAFGGYEVECSGVAEHLAAAGHDVTVLTSAGGAPASSASSAVAVRRELTRLTPDARGATIAPWASLRAVRSAREALDGVRPELIYVWNGSSVAQAAIRVLADSGTPLAFRICEHWFGGLFSRDQFMRELLPADRGPARAVWSLGCRALNNSLPPLRLRPLAPLRTAISWNSEAIRRMVETPVFIDPALERIGHSVPRHGDLYAAVEPDRAPEPRILFLGRVTPYKGVSVAIEALAMLRAEGQPRATLVVVGPEDTDHGTEMRALAARLGTGDAVDFRGQLAPEEAARELAHAHALIVPSIWQEPFPLVTIEGALARVPLVASDVGGIGEGMHHEEHALLFEGGDARGAANALARTLGEPEQTEARVARALERAQEFRIGPYLEQQERFVLDAYETLRAPR
ncbi:MAG TPA: glycosyltransferase family 4 protein [Solirubrobacteraceae bacterium]